ncbi:MAG: hypothetical protein WCF90_03665 [Methanomicrobiales archaeon]
MDTVTLVIILLILVEVVAFFAVSIRIANQWERAVVLFLGKFVGIRSPGLFFIISFI